VRALPEQKGKKFEKNLQTKKRQTCRKVVPILSHFFHSFSTVLKNPIFRFHKTKNKSEKNSKFKPNSDPRLATECQRSRHCAGSAGFPFFFFLKPKKAFQMI